MRGAIKARRTLVNGLKNRLEAENGLAVSRPSISNILDRTINKFDVIASGQVLSAVGTEIKIDLSRDNDGIWLEKETRTRDAHLPLSSPHIMAARRKTRRKASDLFEHAPTTLGITFSHTTVPCRVQTVINAMHPTGEILFCERLLPDICCHPLWRNDLIFPETFLFDKATKVGKFTLRMLYLWPEREKADFLATPDQSDIILGNLDSSIQRPKVSEVRRARKARPSLGVSFGKVPHPVL